MYTGTIMIGVFRERDKLGRRLVLILRGLPCAYGKCTFCPFALEQTLHTSRILEENKKIIEEAIAIAEKEEYKRIAVFNGGSFHELPYQVIEELRPLAKDNIFEIEERSEYVTYDSVTALYNYYAPEKLIIRVGFEVYDEEIREKKLRKGMPNTELYRVSGLREKLRSNGYNVEIWTYLLFGIESIPEDKVEESLYKFRELFDGIVAVRYKKYSPGHPEPVSVSEKLARLLEEYADLVDWGGEQWIIAGKEGSAPG